MKIKMSENYQNQFVTTMRGFTILKDEIKDMDHTDRELQYYLEQGILVVVEEEKIMQTNKNIIDDNPKKERAIKEIINKDNNPKEILKKEMNNVKNDLNAEIKTSVNIKHDEKI